LSASALNVVLGERYKVIPAEVKNYVRGWPAGRPSDPDQKNGVGGKSRSGVAQRT
jgi:pyruvate/oxaloacetate carboxyltransferase